MNENKAYTLDVPPVLTAFCLAGIGGGGLHSMTQAIMDPQTSGLPVLADVAGASSLFIITTIGVIAFVQAVRDYGPKL